MQYDNFTPTEARHEMERLGLRLGRLRKLKARADIQRKLEQDIERLQQIAMRNG